MSRWVAGAKWALLVVVVVIACAAVTLACLADNPWRSGWRTLGGDCGVAAAGTPRSADGAALQLLGSSPACGQAFALQRRKGDRSAYAVTIERGRVGEGELQVTLSAFDGWHRLERTQQRFAAADSLQGARLELIAPADAGLVEVAFVSLGPGRADMRGVRLEQVASLQQPTVDAPALYDEAVQIIGQHALYARHLDPADLQRWRPGEQATPGEARRAVRQVLKALGDNHSFLMDPVRVQESPARSQAAFQSPRWELVDGRLGHLQLPGLLAGKPEVQEQYAQALLEALKQGHRQGVRGWVVDLRNNTGGNMWPMLAGLEPLLRGQDLGCFEDRAGECRDWRNERLPEAQALPDMTGLPVAVLTSGRTASSGEAVAVAFRARPHTRSFGAVTAGLSTGNRGFRLSDGSMLQLTTTRFVDGAGRRYGDALIPDQITSAKSGGDAPPQALQWLSQQP